LEQGAELQQGESYDVTIQFEAQLLTNEIKELDGLFNERLTELGPEWRSERAPGSRYDEQ
jgi:hypothetical protein